MVSPPRTWSSGYLLIIAVPFIGLAITLFDLPRWIEIIGLVLMVSLVGAGASLMRRPRGGWRPSQTLPSGRDAIGHDDRA
jgi:hypothetical protein